MSNNSCEMDPDGTLADIQYDIMEYELGGHFDVDDFVQQVKDLDDWLQNGGMLPDQWR